jgi:ARG and Rhodanese-Phosphatase-superfamily-associated Protein domain
MEVQQNGSALIHKVTNKSDQIILIYDGEKPAKAGHQRNIGNTILIPAKETVIIPESFIKKKRSPHKINRIRSREHAKSSRDYLEHFARVDSQFGTLFVINGKVAGMDCFSRPDVLEKTFMKMIEGYACDAADNFDPKMNSKSSRPEAINFLEMAKESWFPFHG